MSDLCERAGVVGDHGCDAESDYWLDVHWTMADFGEWYSCTDCLPDILESLANRVVESRTPSIEVHPIDHVYE